MSVILDRVPSRLDCDCSITPPLYFFEGMEGHDIYHWPRYHAGAHQGHIFQEYYPSSPRSKPHPDEVLDPIVFPSNFNRVLSLVEQKSVGKGFDERPGFAAERVTIPTAIDGE